MAINVKNVLGMVWMEYIFKASQQKKIETLAYFEPCQEKKLENLSFHTCVCVCEGCFSAFSPPRPMRVNQKHVFCGARRGLRSRAGGMHTSPAGPRVLAERFLAELSSVLPVSERGRGQLAPLGFSSPRPAAGDARSRKAERGVRVCGEL